MEENCGRPMLHLGDKGLYIKEFGVMEGFKWDLPQLMHRGKTECQKR